MEAPEWIIEEIGRLDPLLSLRWNRRRSRWDIHRQDPKSPSKPPALVKTWQDQRGGFLPLDRRLITWIKANDVQRRFAGRQEKYFGLMVQQEVDCDNEAREIERSKAFTEKMAEATDKFNFECKKLDRRGLLTKIGGLR